MTTKTISKFCLLAVLGLASAVFTSCKDDEPKPNNGNGGGDQTIAVNGVSLNETTKTLTIGGDFTLIATVSPDNATNPTVTWTSSNSAVASVANGKVTALAAGSATITVQVGEKTATCEVTVTDPKPTTPNQTDTVVVINGVKWATRNVDAFGTFAEKPESAGMFYQWNRPKAWNATDATVTGWDASYPTGTTWEKANDPSPKGWRVPTKEEMDKLFNIEKVSDEWTTQNGVTGRKFTDKATGNSLFFPAAGWRDDSDGTLYYAGTGGGYWSSAGNGSNFAYGMGFSSDGAGVGNIGRANGLSVRSVAE